MPVWEVSTEYIGTKISLCIDAENRADAIDKANEIALKKYGRRFKKWICRKEGVKEIE
jgi:hypothetical protein